VVLGEGKVTAEASIRVNRMVYLAIGISGIIFGGLSYESMRLQTYLPFPALSVSLWGVLVGLLALLAALAFWAPQRMLRAVALAAGAVQIGGILIWLILDKAPLPPQASVPWLIMMAGVPAVAVAAAAANGRVAWAYTIVVSVLSGLLRAVTTSYPYPILIGLQDGLYSFLLVSVFVALMLATKASAVHFDETAQAARREMTVRAAHLARKRERLLINALVHDSVLSTFLMAGLGRTTAEDVARHAKKTTTLLDSFAARETSRPVTISGLESRLRQAAAKIAHPIEIVVNRTGVVPTIPSDVAAAIVDALAEALRNSVLHADARSGSGSGSGFGAGARLEVSRSLTLDCSASGLRCIVSDDGVGFDTSAVPADRLGIAQSILGRMQRVGGGSAAVRSEQGNGTIVTLAWTPAAAPLAPSPSSAASGRAVEYSFAGIRLLSRKAVRGALLLFVAAHALLAFGDRDPGGPLLMEIGAVVAVSAAAVLVTWPAPYPLPRLTTVRVLVLCAVTEILQLFQGPPAGSLPFAEWHLGAITLVLLVLVAQGRVGWAWTGYAVLVASTIGWAAANGLTPGAGLDLVIRHAGTLLAGSLFVLGLRRSAATLETFTGEQTARAIEHATTVAGLQERESELTRVNSQARGLLDRLADLARMDPARMDPASGHLALVKPALRTECLLVEASLRDAIRGRSLSIEPLITAAYLARARGVEVTLIDDGDDSSEERTIGTVATGLAVARELDLMQEGRLTARILPSGRAEFATIVVESAEQRMLTVIADGSVHEI
jgi:signal transduction histidine kinase